ncbi:MAG: transglutaminase domain-containing protein [Clostridiales bacterium]|jgi:transglutaminase-like putative cysteine protease|nr:transglutaminase domain-containing protein [Clostridiales bacterium]
MTSRKRIELLVGLIISLLIMLTSCGSTGGGGAFEPGDCIVPEFNSESAEEESGFEVDYSGLASGYVAVKAGSDYEKLVLQINFGDAQYNYWFDSDNKILVVPLQYGDGTYVVKVLKNTTGDKYAEIYSQSKSVQLSDEFQPFIRSNSMVNYTKDSNAVQEASSLASQSENDADFVKNVYKYIEGEVDYDQEFADSNPEIYYPVLDNTLSTGKGICFDYAALAAGMLRSQGIPTKLITGYVNLDGDLYHAWNMVYIKNEGWITAEISVSPNDWNRIDITLDDTGDISKLGSDSYTQKDIY